MYTHNVKKFRDFPVPSRDVFNQILPGREDGEKIVKNVYSVWNPIGYNVMCSIPLLYLITLFPLFITTVNWDEKTILFQKTAFANLAFSILQYAKIYYSFKIPSENILNFKVLSFLFQNPIIILPFSFHYFWKLFFI
jgi:hypothetical protein